MKKEFQLGDAPIEKQYMQTMRELAQLLDQAFNGNSKVIDRKTGFVLLVFPFNNHGGRCVYISNGADRRDIAVLLREQAARFEGRVMPEQPIKQ